MSAVGPNFPINMTWEHLILLSLSKKRPKNIFPVTGGPPAGVSATCESQVVIAQFVSTMVPAAFY